MALIANHPFQALLRDKDSRSFLVASIRGTSGTDTSDTSVQGQLYAADGSPMGDQLEVDLDGWLHGYPSVAVNAGGEFVVVWHDNDPYGTDTWAPAIDAKRYNSFGNMIASELQINTYTTDHQRATWRWRSTPPETSWSRGRASAPAARTPTASASRGRPARR